MSLAGEALRTRGQKLKVPIHKAPKHSELPYSGVASTVPDNQGFLNRANDQKDPFEVATLLYHTLTILSWTWENISLQRFGS